VNRVGKIEALKADNFLRFLASDQYFQFWNWRYWKC
jgi:hypothetical protein